MLDIEYNLFESLAIFQDNLLQSINAELVSFKDIFDYDLIDKNIDLELLSDNSKFITALQNKGMKVATVENTDDYETFVKKSMKFMPIRQVDANDLMNPKYIIIQNRIDNEDKWDELRLYKVRDNIRKFYDTLSSKTIELKYKGKNYIYTTSNSGNEWDLKNPNEANDKFKTYLRKEDLKKLINDTPDVKITII